MMRIIKCLAPMVVMALCALAAGPASAQGDSVFEEGYCRDSAALDDQASLALIRSVSPHLVKEVNGKLEGAVPLREISKEKALQLMAGSESRRHGIIDFLLDSEFGAGCVYYLGAETLRVVNEKFDLDLTTPIKGWDENSKAFNMTAMIVGQSRLVITYDRSRIRYYSEKNRRKLSINGAIRMTMGLTTEDNRPVKLLYNVGNLEVDTGFPFGWEDVEAMRQTRGVVQSYVLGAWRGNSPVVPIARRDAVPEGYWADSAAVPPAAQSRLPIDLSFSSLESLRRLSEVRSPFLGH